MADRQRSQALAFIAVGGGFPHPFLVGGDENAQLTLFTYDALLVAARWCSPASSVARAQRVQLRADALDRAGVGLRIYTADVAADAALPHALLRAVSSRFSRDRAASRACNARTRPRASRHGARPLSPRRRRDDRRASTGDSRLSDCVHRRRPLAHRRIRIGRGCACSSCSARSCRCSDR